MSTRKDAPPRPVGTGLAAQFFQWVWDVLAAGRFPFIDSDTIKVDRTHGGYMFKAVPRSGSSSSSSSVIGFAGDYDPTKSYKKGQMVRVMVTDNGVTFRFWFLYGAANDVAASNADLTVQPFAYQLIAAIVGKPVSGAGNAYDFVLDQFLSGPTGAPNGPGGSGDSRAVNNGKVLWQLLSFNSLQFPPP